MVTSPLIGWAHTQNDPWRRKNGKRRRERKWKRIRKRVFVYARSTSYNFSWRYVVISYLIFLCNLSWINFLHLLYPLVYAVCNAGHCSHGFQFCLLFIVFAAYSCFMMTSSGGNIFRFTGPLWRECTAHRWIPLTKASEAELWCFLSSTPEQTDEQTIETPVIWHPSRALWRHCDVFFNLQALWMV